MNVLETLTYVLSILGTAITFVDSTDVAQGVAEVKGEISLSVLPTSTIGAALKVYSLSGCSAVNLRTELMVNDIVPYPPADWNGAQVTSPWLYFFHCECNDLELDSKQYKMRHVNKITKIHCDQFIELTSISLARLLLPRLYGRFSHCIVLCLVSLQ